MFEFRPQYTELRASLSIGFNALLLSVMHIFRMKNKANHKITKYIKHTVCIQIFEVHNFRGWTIFRIFAILFSRIAFHSKKSWFYFQGLNAHKV